MVIVHIAMLNYQRVSHELPIRSMFHPRNGQKWDDYVGETVFFLTNAARGIPRVSSDRVHGSCVTKCNKPKTKDFCQMISWRRTTGQYWDVTGPVAIFQWGPTWSNLMG